MSTPTDPAATTTPPAAAPPSRRGLLLVALGLLAAGFVVAIVAIVYRPDYVVLVRMDDTEEAWFRARLAGFADHRHIRLATRSYRDGAELERLLAAETLGRKRRVLLAQVPQSMLGTLVEEDLVRAVEDVRGRPRARALLAAMAPEAAAAASARGRVQYLPATIESPLLFYSKKRVAEAVAGWEEERADVAAALARVNGGGLPRDYRLEADPADWDTYDLAVVAAYWAGRPYDGLTVPRVAHAAAGEAAALDLASLAFAQGALPEDLLALDGVALRDALAWESLFVHEGWYHPSMTGESWDASDLLTAAAQGQLFLGWLDLPNLFRLHGTGAPGLEGFLHEPADLGVARMPRGASLELAHGAVARTGGPRAARAGSWWGIPRSAPDPTLAVELAEELAGREFQQDWARAFGHLPARRDLLAELELVFEPSWQFDLARAAKQQAIDLGRPLPRAARWERVEAGLVGAWREACVTGRRTRPIDLAVVLERAGRAARGPAAAAAPGDDATPAPGD